MWGSPVQRSLKPSPGQGNHTGEFPFSRSLRFDPNDALSPAPGTKPEPKFHPDGESDLNEGSERRGHEEETKGQRGGEVGVGELMFRGDLSGGVGEAMMADMSEGVQVNDDDTRLSGEST